MLYTVVHVVDCCTSRVKWRITFSQKQAMRKKIESKKDAISVKDAALEMNCSHEHVRRLARAGKLDSQRRGKYVFIETASIDRYLGRGDREQIRRACEWMTVVARDASRHRVTTLLMTTFQLTPADASELVARWAAAGGRQGHES